MAELKVKPYFDSSVFMAVFNGEGSAKVVREMLKYFQGNRIRLVTSIITVQEVSVDVFRDGTTTADNHAFVRRFARIESITRDIAMTAAKIEAKILDSYATPDEKKVDNKRRKFDCFHIATAQEHGCTHLYSMDGGMLNRKATLKIKGMQFVPPRSIKEPLFEVLEDDL